MWRGDVDTYGKVVNVIRAAGDPQPILDGYGLPFCPGTHALYVKFGTPLVCATPTTSVPVVEPVWKDYPAGRRKCPVISEDKDCEQFPA